MNDASEVVKASALPKSESEIAPPEIAGASVIGSATAAVERVSGRIGRYRWAICALLFFATTINYVDRQVLGFLAPDLQRSIGWNEAQYGWIVTSFTIAYAISLLVVGRIMDWLGTRKGLSLAVIVWSLAAMAHALAGVAPETITYVEAHGTATPLGDPIEVAALTKAFREGTRARQFCALGSAKSNVGHLDVAAGVTGLIKTSLALRHKILPGTLHFTKPNSKLDLENSPFYVNANLQEWKGSPGTPRRAGVSSFGTGGTNAHVVLEEAPELPTSGPSRPWQLLPLSADAMRAGPSPAREAA